MGEIETRRVDNCEEVECQSCHAEFIVSELDDAICRGCGRAICQGCTDAFGHCDEPGEFGRRGKHGTGDPADRLTHLEAENRELRALLIDCQGWLCDCETDHDMNAEERHAERMRRINAALDTPPKPADETEE